MARFIWFSGGAGGGIGPTGPQGIQGIAGDTGPQGGIGATGATGIEWQGLWSSDTDYVDNDAVFYEGASWFASGDPALGEVPSGSSTNWYTLSLQGIQGIAGAQGSQGVQGVTGSQGEDGIRGPQGVQGIQGVNASDVFKLTYVTAIVDLQTQTNELRRLHQ
tara:strand:- start:469 stop:954 length:486 start_codon:yes stop_codon:yes gene_type:complete